MYDCFNEVYNDLRKIGRVDQLDHAVSLKMFMQKLASEDSAAKYVEFQMLEETRGKTELQIVQEFMDTERQRQKPMEEL